MTKELQERLSAFKDSYLKAIQTKDYAEFSNLSRFKLIEGECKDKNQLIVDCFLIKAKILVMYGDFKAMKEELNDGLRFCPDTYKNTYYLEWALSYFVAFASALRIGKKQELAVEAIEVLKQVVYRSGDKEYDFLIAKCLQAFASQVCDMDKDSMLAVFKNCQFIPVPLKDINDPLKQQLLFGHIYKGIVVALELRDKTLLENLLKVISFDDQVLYGENDLFVKFQKTIQDTIDIRQEFRADFEHMYSQASKYEAFFPNYKMIQNCLAAKDLKTLRLLFASFN